MFSQLGPLFKTTFRQAESSDTRQAIPHNEREQQRKKNHEDNEKNSKSSLWDDDTSVSVVALRTFLLDFLKTIPGTKSKPVRVAPNAQNQEKEIKRTKSLNAQAANAYENTAQQAQDYNPEYESIELEPTEDQLQSEEIRDIHKLIHDLNTLSHNNIQTLHILRAESFIESLKNAVYLAKSKI